VGFTRNNTVAPSAGYGSCPTVGGSGGGGAGGPGGGSPVGSPGLTGLGELNAPLGPEPGVQIGIGGTATAYLNAPQNNVAAPDTSSFTVKSECVRIPLKSGGTLRFTWSRNAGETRYYIGISRDAANIFWLPGGAGGVFSFLPPLSPTTHYNMTTEEGSVSFQPQFGVANAEVTRIAAVGTTYFSVYEERLGAYFEYYAGSSVPSNDPAWGVLTRRYDLRGNELVYHYARATDPHSFLRRITGDVGRIIPYFEYANETVPADFMGISKIHLLDLDSPENSRTLYFDYRSAGIAPILTKIVNPEGCVTQFEGELGPDFSDYYRIFREVDAEGYTTYFVYGPWPEILTKTVEPEGRITYYDYVIDFNNDSHTKKTQLNRGTADWYWQKSSSVDRMPMIWLKQDELGNITYWQYHPTLKRVTSRIDPNGNLSYFEYMGGTAGNKYALTRELSVFNGAQTYYGYDTAKYDLVKQAGPRDAAGFSVATYYEYDANRTRTATVDALGNRSRIGRDSAGRIDRRQDARLNTTYYNYGNGTGFLDSEVDAEGNVAYFGYNSWRDQTLEVSPRWAEPGAGFAAFTTYYEYDKLDRPIKQIDRLGKVGYFEWTSRGDLLSATDPRGTDTEHAYNGLRLRTRTTIRDAAGSVLTEQLDGYDIYKNRARTQNARGNATYFFYDDLDRLTASKNALEQSSYYAYDSMGNLTRRVNARGDGAYYFYDLLSRETARRDPLGHASYFFYDLADNRTHVVDPSGNASYFFYDALDRVQATRDALGNPTYFFFDAVGNRTEVRDARGNAAYFFYDRLNRGKAARDAQGKLSYFFYDRGSNPTGSVNARGNAVYFFYDRLDRVDSSRDALGNATYFFYDAVGNRTELRDARGMPSYFFYDGLSRMSAARDSLGGMSYFFYDRGSNATGGVNARGNAAYFFYDRLDRLEAGRDALGNATYFFYDAAGDRTEQRDARGNASYFFYDGLSRLSAARDALGALSYFFYDAIGNPTAARDPLGNAAYFFVSFRQSCVPAIRVRG